MAERKSSNQLSSVGKGFDLLKYGKKGYDIFSGLTAGPSAIGGSFGPTAGMAGGNPGLAALSQGSGSLLGSASGVSGLGAGLGLGAAGLIGGAILSKMAEPSPGMSFQGAEAGWATTPATLVEGGGRAFDKEDPSSPKGAQYQRLDTPGYQSDNFNFTIGTRDMPVEMTYPLGNYLDDAFSKIQETTSVDLNKIIPYLSIGGAPKNESDLIKMGNDVIQQVEESIRRGSPPGEGGQYVSGRQRAYRVGDGSGRDKYEGGSYMEPVYSDLPTFEADPGFNAPEISSQLGSYDGATTTGGGDSVTYTGTGGGQSAATDRFWDEYKNEWFSDENNAKMLYQGQADYLADEARKRNEAIQAATGEQTANIDALVSQYAKPIGSTIMGDSFSFVPRGARSTISGLTDVGQTQLGNIQDAANTIFQTAPITAPGAGKSAYLAALSDILGKETSAESAAAAAAATQRRLEQAEPGFVDYAGQAVKIGGGIADIWDTAKDWDWLKGLG